MGELSAGILVYRMSGQQIEVLLVHPGGPFWARKDDGAWSIPKGLFKANETPLEAARREFEEETGFFIDGKFIELGEVKQPSGKRIVAWAVEGDLDAEAVRSNCFEMEWPPKSGTTREFPEVDRAGWFGIASAGRKILRGQREFLLRLVEVLGPLTENSAPVDKHLDAPIARQGSLFDL